MVRKKAVASTRSKAPSKKAAGRRPGKAASPSTRRAEQLKIRMYNTGFGDCFLITIPAPDRPRKVLIDCGKHSLSKCKPPLKRIVSQVQADLVEPDGANGKKQRIDLLIVTHRHLDHVNGFALDGWENVEVGEIWMPWTEDPNDPVARRICDRQSRRSLQLQPLIARLSMDAAQRSDLLSYAGNNMRNEVAMNRLHKGFRGNPRRRFLPTAKTGTRPISPACLPSVSIHVLGPSRDEKVIKCMDPPESEAYFRLTNFVDGDDAASRAPFSPKWIMTRKEYEQWFEEVLGKKSDYDPLERFSEDTQTHFRDLVESPERELAATLEQAVNGTSLVLAFQIGSKVLFFPGDAQWGTWSEILENDRWRRLLQTVDFYKVGHHGSHNATPTRFVQELLPTGVKAMVPTDDVATWPKIPKTELLAALTKKKIPFVRSDRAEPADQKCFKRVMEDGYTLYVELALPL
jgi:beta-lactamase superfamily II metal-dependent hydrolase